MLYDPQCDRWSFTWSSLKMHLRHSVSHRGLTFICGIQGWETTLVPPLEESAFLGEVFWNHSHGKLICYMKISGSDDQILVSQLRLISDLLESRLKWCLLHLSLLGNQIHSTWSKIVITHNFDRVLFLPCEHLINLLDAKNLLCFQIYFVESYKDY